MFDDKRKTRLRLIEKKNLSNIHRKMFGNEIKEPKSQDKNTIVFDKLIK